MKNFRTFIRGKDGVTSIEYGILAAGLAVAIAAVVADDGVFVKSIGEIFERVVQAVPNNPGTPGTPGS